MNTDYYRQWELDPAHFEPRFEEICKSFKVAKDKVVFYAQQDEDKYIVQHILKEKIDDGVFLEIGAFDGISYSNTKTLEDFFGFSGILIEAQGHLYEKLVRNRPNTQNYQTAVSSSDVEFIEFEGWDGTGGIKETIHNHPKKNWRTFYKKRLSKVRNTKMKDILSKSRFSYIDIMVIDVEGGELEVLKSIDFLFPIYLILIEAHSDQKEKNELVHEFLIDKKFKFIERQRGNEVWVNPNYFRRNLFSL